MTREQAIAILKQPDRIGCHLIKANDEESNKYNQESTEALNMAIKALELQPSDDCVSRDAIRLKIAEMPKYTEGRKLASVRHLEDFLERELGEPIEATPDMCIGFTIALECIRDFIIALPPVTPVCGIATVHFSKDDLREICNERIEIACKHGTCKDCANYVVGALDEEICLRGHELIHKDFYCKDFEKRGAENG